MTDPIELPVMEGLLCFDGRVLELFRNDGREHPWRLHAELITAIDQERRKDRIELQFHTNPRFYESAGVALEYEPAAAALIEALQARRA